MSKATSVEASTAWKVSMTRDLTRAAIDAAMEILQDHSWNEFWATSNWLRR